MQVSYGLAWVIQDYRGHRLVSHGGVIDGFRVQLVLLPDDGFALALLSNRHQTKLNLALSNNLIDRLFGLPPRDWNDYFHKLERRADEIKRAAKAKLDALRQPGPPPRSLADYTGEYEHPAYGRASVSIEGKSLKWQWSSFRGELAFHHAEVFHLQNELLDDPLIEFRLNGGKVEGFEFLNLNFKRK